MKGDGGEGLRGDDYSCAGLGNMTDIWDGGRNLSKPTVKFFRKGRAVVRIPRAGVAGFSNYH